MVAGMRAAYTTIHGIDTVLFTNLLHDYLRIPVYAMAQTWRSRIRRAPVWRRSTASQPHDTHPSVYALSGRATRKTVLVGHAGMSEPIGMVLCVTTQEPNGQPHDALFRLVFADPDNASSELRSVLPPRLAARIDLDNLQPQPGPFVDPELRHRHVDLLFRTTAAGGRDGYLYLLVEHQRTSDPRMALRMMTYQTRIWDHHLRTDRTAAPSGPLPLIIPVVIYQGPRRWTAATDIAGLIDADDELKADAGELVPHVSYLVDDLTTLDDAALRARPLTPAARITFVVITKAPGDDDVTTWLGQWFDDFIRLTGLWDHERLLKGIFTYLLRTGTTPVDHLIRFGATLGPAAEEAAMTTAEQIRAKGFIEGRVEGRVEGRAEGHAEGLASLLTSMLTRKFGTLDKGAHDLVAGATEEQIIRWSSRLVEGAATLDDVFGR